MTTPSVRRSLPLLVVGALLLLAAVALASRSDGEPAPLSAEGPKWSPDTTVQPDSTSTEATQPSIASSNSTVPQLAHLTEPPIDEVIWRPDIFDYVFLGSSAFAPVVAEPVPAVVPPNIVLPGVPTTDERLFFIGDSVMLAAAPTAAGLVPSWNSTIDAEIGRRVGPGAQVIRERRDDIGDVAVILLGHNYFAGEGFRTYFNDIMHELVAVDRVVWVTVAEWSPGQREVNDVIRQSGPNWPNMVLADWQQLTATNPGYLRGDRVHLTGRGVIALADLMVRAVGPGPITGVPPLIRPPVQPAPDPEPNPPSTTSTTTTVVLPSTTTSSTSTTTTSPVVQTSTTSITTSTTTTSVPVVSTTTTPDGPATLPP